MLKGLSLWEPWASLMAAGAKGNETRSWPTRHRGPLAICAAKHWDLECEQMLHTGEVQNALWRLYAPSGSSPFCRITKSMLPFGKVLCVVNVVDCVHTEILKADWREGIIKPQHDEHKFGNYHDHRFAWMTDVRKLFRLQPPVLVRGAQGIFTLPPDIERQVREQWKEVA